MKHFAELNDCPQHQLCTQTAFCEAIGGKYPVALETAEYQCGWAKNNKAQL